MILYLPGGVRDFFARGGRIGSTSWVPRKKTKKNPADCSKPRASSCVPGAWRPTRQQQRTTTGPRRHVLADYWPLRGCKHRTTASLLLLCCCLSMCIVEKKTEEEHTPAATPAVEINLCRHTPKMSGDMSIKAKRELSRVKG